MSEMTEERLALGKKLAVTTRKRQASGHEVPIHTAVLADFVEDNDRLRAENERLTAWVEDLQSGMYVNCVYCGHRYGPGETTPVSMADALKAHVEQCPEHPMSALRAEVDRWVGHYADLLITGLEIESAHNKLRQSVKDYIANNPGPIS